VNEEMAYLAYHLHWSHAELMGLDHRSRRRWVEQVSALNERVSAQA
jgi:Family of unknown function (DUF6760)